MTSIQEPLPNPAEKTTVAAIQMISAPDVATNIDTAGRLIAEAVEKGAQLVLLPEYWPAMGMQDTDKVSIAERPGEGPIQAFMADAARRHRIWLIGGTLPLVAEESGKVRNALMVYDPQGERLARYDKIHLFNFTRGEESYDEARTIVPGREVGTFDAPFGRVGLSVCYDLRFPELYRQLQAELLLVPSAFTHVTGQAHWEALLRARAIENLAYVVAPAQGGLHENGRRTWGHSLVLDPWGTLLARRGEDGEGVVVATLDRARLQQVRTQLPALAHRVL